MKIIGWERKGNVVRFALGKDDIDDWSGDDWHKAPYEHNAVSTPFGIEEYADITFGYGVSVLEAQVDWYYPGNSLFCMDDFKDWKVPIFAIDVTGEERFYSLGVNKEDVYGIFMGDRFADIPWKILGGIVVAQWKIHFIYWFKLCLVI